MCDRCEQAVITEPTCVTLRGYHRQVLHTQSDGYVDDDGWCEACESSAHTVVPCAICGAAEALAAAARASSGWLCSSSECFGIWRDSAPEGEVAS